MNDGIFAYRQPVEIVFGAGARTQLAAVAERYGLSHGLLVVDPVLVRNGRADELTSAAPVVEVFDAFGADPDISAAERAAGIAVEKKADFFVAMGGGSSIDLAKFAALAAGSRTSAKDMFYGRLPQGGLPVIALPATAGTGSEVTGVSVMSDGTQNVKKPLTSSEFFPKAAIVDPELCLSVPPRVTATCGLDALAHALEAYWCRAHNPISDALALKAVRLVFKALERAYRDGSDIGARTEMSLGALLAGLAFAPTRTAAVHACSYPLSETYRLPHGEACAFTLDSFVRLNAECERARMDELARDAGFCSAEEMADEIARLKVVTGMRRTLTDIGCDDAVGLARACLAHPLMNNNPVLPDEDGLVRMFENMRDAE